MPSYLSLISSTLDSFANNPQKTKQAIDIFIEIYPRTLSGLNEQQSIELFGLNQKDIASMNPAIENKISEKIIDWMYLQLVTELSDKLKSKITPLIFDKFLATHKPNLAENKPHAYYLDQEIFIRSLINIHKYLNRELTQEEYKQTIEQIQEHQRFYKVAAIAITLVLPLFMIGFALSIPFMLMTFFPPVVVIPIAIALSAASRERSFTKQDNQFTSLVDVSKEISSVVINDATMQNEADSTPQSIPAAVNVAPLPHPETSPRVADRNGFFPAKKTTAQDEYSPIYPNLSESPRN